MILTSRSVEELALEGWVEVHREEISRLEVYGVPIYLAARERQKPTTVCATAHLAPGWAMQLISAWPFEPNMHRFDEPLLRKIITEAHRRGEPALAQAAEATMRLGGREAVQLLLGEYP